MHVPDPSQMRKALVALAAALTEALNRGLVPEGAQAYVSTAIAVLGVLAVFLIPNAPATDTPAPDEVPAVY